MEKFEALFSVWCNVNTQMRNYCEEYIRTILDITPGNAFTFDENNVPSVMGNKDVISIRLSNPMEDNSNIYLEVADDDAAYLTPIYNVNVNEVCDIAFTIQETIRNRNAKQ